ncbi:MAG TPA: hypothetical protein VNL15_04175, partial [Dehalococcoidia bacterium]|nr:hypothetical protein [Dehalococcoidia bacterium]
MSKLKATGRFAVIAAVGGLAFLSLVLLACGESSRSDRPLTDLSGLTVEETYSRIEEAITRPGFVFHSVLETAAAREGGQLEELKPFYTKEFWIDAEQQALREEFRLDPSRVQDFGDSLNPQMVLVLVNRFVYVPDDLGEALRFDAEEACPATSSAVLARLLECGVAFS